MGAAFRPGVPWDGVCMQQLIEIVVSGLLASHLTLWWLSSWEMGICPDTSSSSAVEGPPVLRYRPVMRRMQEL